MEGGEEVRDEKIDTERTEKNFYYLSGVWFG
jgi:hypothetical protein